MLKKIAAISVFTFAIAAAAFGLTPQRMSVEVPFDFQIAEQALPAGSYIVNLEKANQNGFVAVTNRRTGKRIIVPTAPSGMVRPGADARLVFHKASSRYILAELSGVEGSYVRRVPRPKADAELGSQKAGTYEVAVITAR